MEWKDGRLQLPNVTLMAMTSVKMRQTIKAMQYSMRGIEFGDVVLLSDKRPFYLPKTIRHETIRHLGNVDDYSHFCVYELANHIKTDYALIVHHDGFVVNPMAWRTEDSVRYRDPSGNIVRVGNGVSLRSKRLLELPSVENLPWEKTDSGDHNEDCYLCCKERFLLEEKGIRFAPLEVAVYFGREHGIPENEGIEPFLFHQWRGENQKYPRFVNVPEKVVQKLKRK